ncbi:hypothetical protein B0675_39655 [Streptomyces sp. M41(2017)]|uniref:hypothetical protein n=1 Tax=Streptomyces sp. M41(2017) TaxID=1955065 RepID=UPI0009C121CD|nr:hypothetical protein [Streptomyces sp. M41(2017)]OQQ12943.1 hypothetical protein B0675_39655 [Streptomyces sp. M41(2017)]
MATPDSAPDLINALYAAALRLEKAAGDAHAIAEQLALGAAEARRAYEVASMAADGPYRNNDLRDA